MARGSKALALGFLLSTTGCPADSGDGATAGTSAGTDDGGFVEACGLPTPCGQYPFECNPVDGGNECAGVPYPEGLTCMLETLAAGDQAQLHVNFNGYVTGEVEWIDVAVYGRDAAIYQHGQEDSVDLSQGWDEAQQCALKSAPWFQACLADAGDDAQHVACMNPYQWFEGCAETMACL